MIYSYLNRLKGSIRRYSMVQMSIGSYAIILEGFIRTALLARILGPLGYGSMVLAIGLVDFLYLLFSVEPDGAMVRFVAEDTAHKNERGISQKMTMGLILSSIRGGAVLLLLLFFGGLITRIYGSSDGGGDLARLAMIYSFSAGFYSIERTSNAFLLSLKSFRSFSFQMCFSAALFVSLPVLFAYMTRSVPATLIGLVFANAVSMMMSLYLSVRMLRGQFGRVLPFAWVRWSEARPFLRFCFLSSLNSTMNASAQNMDVALLGLFLPREMVGFYNIGIKFTRMSGMILQPLRNVLFPLLAEDWGHHRIESIRLRMRRFMRIAFLTAVPLFLVLYFGADWIITLYSGVEYLPAATVLRIAALSAAVLCVMSMTRLSLMVVDYPEGILFYSILGSILRLGGCLLLVPPFGLVGAAWVENVVTMATNFYGNLLMRRRLRLREKTLNLQGETA